MKIFSQLYRGVFLTGALNKQLSMQQMHFICRQLSFALAGGMPLPAALVLVGTEMPQALCRQFLLQLGQAVQEGQSMAQALGQIKIGFSPVLLEFVLAGEQNGAMQETLAQAADYFQQQNQIRQMLFSALFYPFVLLILMLAAFSAMFLFVVPAVVQTYDNFQAELPFLTRGILLVRAWLQHNWAILLMAGLLLGCLLLWQGGKALRQPQQRDKIKKLLLHFPLIGRLYQQYWFIQIAQALGLMLSSGMLLVSCLQATEQIYRRSLFSSELKQITQALAAGHSFEAGLRHCSFMPKMARQMLIISEQTGALPQALLQLSQYYQQQFQQRLQTLISLLEPGFVIFLGLMILLLAGSLFLPLVQSYQYLL